MPPDTTTRDLLARMPKAELHLHLDGSLRPATALELAEARGLASGMDLDAMRARLVAPMPCLDQADLLRAFDLPIRLMQDAESLARITHELVEDVASDGTRYAEIRWAPSLHVRGGLSLRSGIAAVVAGAHSGMRQTGITVRLIAVALRTFDPVDEARMAKVAVDFVDDGLTGFDCAGREVQSPDPMRFAGAYDIARARGLGITCHAGEWGGAAQVRLALALRPSRIAHGPLAVDDPTLMADLIERDVTLDLCPTSNVQAAIVPSLAAHPIARLHRTGVPVTLSTDSRTVSDVTLVQEYANAIDAIGMTPMELWTMDRHALTVAFLHHDETLRARLLSEFDAFAAVEPALRATG